MRKENSDKHKSHVMTNTTKTSSQGIGSFSSKTDAGQQI
uniref:Uncharacterized protein n=1 Tax=Rhizophora mucronata TaxID=61149 RepID=A0A2P2Q775_RHIMU